MPQGALPPDAAVASGRYHLRRQVSVEGRVPLRRHIRRFCGKIVEPGKGFASRTIGAVASAERSGRNHGGVAVAQQTFPPGLAVAGRRDISSAGAYCTGLSPQPKAAVYCGFFIISRVDSIRNSYAGKTCTFLIIFYAYRLNAAGHKM